MKARRLMADRMEIVIQVENGRAVEDAELLAVVYLYLHLAQWTKHRSASNLNI